MSYLNISLIFFTDLLQTFTTGLVFIRFQKRTREQLLYCMYLNMALGYAEWMCGHYRCLHPQDGKGNIFSLFTTRGIPQSGSQSLPQTLVPGPFFGGSTPVSGPMSLVVVPHSLTPCPFWWWTCHRSCQGAPQDKSPSQD